MSAPLLVAHVVRSLEVGGLENGVVNVVGARRPELRHTIICMTTGGAMRATSRRHGY